MRSYTLYSDTVRKAFLLLLRRARHLERTESLLPPERPVTAAIPRTAMKETQYSLTSKSSKSFILKRSTNSYIAVSNHSTYTPFCAFQWMFCSLSFSTLRTFAYFPKPIKHKHSLTHLINITLDGKVIQRMTTNNGNCRQVGQERDAWRAATRKALVLLW